MKKVVIIILIIAVCVGLYYANQIFNGNQTAIEITVAKVAKGTLIQTAQAAGNIEPAKTIKVRTEVDGNVMEKKIKDGAIVTQGQVLLEVDREKLKKDVLNAEIKLKKVQNDLKNLVENTGPYDKMQTESNYAKSTIELDYTQKNLESMKRIYAQDIITRRQLEDAQKAYDLQKMDYLVAEKNLKNQKDKFDKDVKESQGEVQIAEADLKEAQLKLSKASVTAPISGSIVEDIIKEKRYVGVGDEIFSIGDLSKFNAKVKVDELDIGKVKVGQPATISSEAMKDKKMLGHVVEIAAQATRQTFAEIEVTIEIDSTFGLGVRPNLSVDADIQTQKFDNVLKVPVESVVKQDNKNYVFLVQGNHVKKKEVTAGASNSDTIIIEKGLKEGDSIAQQGAGRLKDNDQIKIKKPDKTKK